MSSITLEIIQWANKKLPFWQQVALDMILAGEPFSDGEYDGLLQYLLEDNGLATKQKKRPKLRFNETSQVDHSKKSQGIRLEKIYNLQNVNALVGAQSLPFSQALTSIYGETGSGKSGYARVLGCAGFTRGDKEVLPDVTESCDDETVICAEIQVSSDGQTKDIHYNIDKQCPELSAFYVFDSTSVRVHLRDKNKINFSPASLHCLKQLSYETDKVRELLRNQIEENKKPHTFSSHFAEESAIRELIEGINSESDILELEKLGTLSPAEIEQKKALKIDIAKLQIEDISKQISTLTQQKADMESLLLLLQGADAKLNDEALSDIEKIRERYLESKSKAEKISVNQFKSDDFSQIGTDSWYKFVQAAKELSEAERPSEEKYPIPDDRCLLCHQPLSTEAYELLLRLWEFLEGEAQKKLKETETTIKQRRRELGGIDLGFFTDQMPSHRYLVENNAQLQEQITAYSLNVVSIDAR